MEYKIIYSKRKTIGLTIKDGTLTVRAPFGTKDDKIKGVLSRHSAWIMKHLESSQRKSSLYDLTEEQIKALKKDARSYFKTVIAYYANIMGLNYGRVSITSAKRRFGSCSSKGNICFSYRLMLYPECAREYVVVHELAHLKHMNHGKDFYKLIESVLPDYKERMRLLK